MYFMEKKGLETIIDIKGFLLNPGMLHKKLVNFHYPVSECPIVLYFRIRP